MDGPATEPWSDAELKRFIRANLPLVPVPGIPEIRLHKAQPASGLWRLAERDRRFAPPYWAHYWAGGLALARYILDHPETVAGRRVLDLGAGSGLVGIAVAKAGASAVTAADIDRYAMPALLLNAEANGVTLAARLGDATVGSLPAVDLVAAGDVFYERDLAETVIGLLDRCVVAGVDVLVGDPGRAYLPRARLRALAQYAVPDFGEAEQMRKPSTVFAVSAR